MEPDSSSPEERNRGFSPLQGFFLLTVSAAIFVLGSLAWGRGPLWLSAGFLPFLAFALPAILWGSSAGRVSEVLPSSRISLKGVWVAVITVAGGSVTGLAASAMISRLPGASGEETFFLKWILSVPAWQQLIFFVLIPALCEEILFRGGLIASLKGLPPIVVVVASGSFFALFHVSFYRFIPVMILGSALAVVVVRTENIWLSMCGHAVHNGVIILIVNFSGEGGTEPFPWVFVACMAVIGIVLFACGCLIPLEREPEPVSDSPEEGLSL